MDFQEFNETWNTSICDKNVKFAVDISTRGHQESLIGSTKNDLCYIDYLRNATIADVTWPTRQCFKESAVCFVNYGAVAELQID